VLVGLVVVLGGLYGLLALANGRDDAGVGAGAASGPGTLEEVDGGGTPPTSGPHESRNVTSERHVDEDALLTALEQGDVVVVHPPGRTPAALTRLQEDVSGAFDPELAAAGQMVIVTPWPGVSDVQALAYRRRLRAKGPSDPRLRAFAEAWLGQGKGGAG
jgi:hypothetical protein